MSFFPITKYRLFNDPFDRFFGDQLHLFDPWRDFDTFPTAMSMAPNSFRWINEPRRTVAHSSSSSYFNTSSNSGATNIPLSTITLKPVHKENFRVQMNVAGFNPDTIRTRVEGRKVILEAKQEDRQSDGDYSIREIRKTYELPEHADVNNLASFVTPNNMLVIEVPVNSPMVESRSLQTMGDTQALAQFGQFRDPIFDYAGFLGTFDFHPRLVDSSMAGQKKLLMSVAMPNYRPDQIKVSVKNDELVVQGEHSYSDSNRSERSFFTKSITLPPGTQIDQLQSHLTSDGQLEIQAPFFEPSQRVQAIEVQRN